jgi:cbb3-type cytochrome oxidase subunit 3
MLGVIFVAAVLVVGALAVWAWVLLKRVRQQDDQAAAALLKLEEDSLAQRARVNKSIQIIAQSLLKGNEISLTEAAMRIAVLLESLGIADSDRELYSPIFLLAEATAHIPILDEWKKLPRPKKLEFDKSRLKHEGDYGDFVMQSCRTIIGKSF